MTLDQVAGDPEVVVEAAPEPHVGREGRSPTAARPRRTREFAGSWGDRRPWLAPVELVEDHDRGHREQRRRRLRCDDRLDEDEDRQAGREQAGAPLQDSRQQQQDQRPQRESGVRGGVGHADYDQAAEEEEGNVAPEQVGEEKEGAGQVEGSEEEAVAGEAAPTGCPQTARSRWPGSQRPATSHGR